MKLNGFLILLSINIILLFTPLYGQSETVDSSAAAAVKIGWIANPAITEINDAFRDNTLQLIDNGAASIIITGKLTEHTSLKEFAALKKFVKELSVPVKILPSYSDLYSTPYSELNYNEYFDDRNFVYIKSNFSFVGINLLSPFSDSAGHFSPNQENLLNSETEDIKDSSLVFLFTNFSPARVDNWRNVEAAFNGKKLPVIFLNSTPKEISNQYYFIYPSEEESFYSIWVNDSSVVVENQNGDSLFNRAIPKNSDLLNTRKINPVFISKQPFVKKLWENRLASETTVAPLIYKGKYYVLRNDGLLTCFDGDGSEFYDYDLLADARVNPGIIDGYFIAATLQGDLFSLNAANGDQLQTIGFESPITTDLLLFEFPVKVKTMAEKTSGSKGVALFGNAEGKAFCYDVETFEKIWESGLSSSPLCGKPLYSKNQIFIEDGKTLFAVNVLNGALLWKWSSKTSGEKISGNVVEWKSEIFLTTSKGRLISLDKNLGTVNWETSKFNATGIGVAENGRLLYVKDADKKLILADIKNGKFKKSFPLNIGSADIENKVQNINRLTFTAGRYSLFRIKDNKKYSTVIESEKSPITFFKYLAKGKLLILNMDGTLALFKISE